MKSFVYTAWDGTQTPFTLERKGIVRAFLDNIMEGLSPSMALAQMLWDGFPLAGLNFRVMGLKEILQELQQKKEDLLSQCSLEHAFDDPINGLRDLLDQEAMTRRQQGAALPPAFEQLPVGLLEKIRSLQDFPFIDEQSREAFEDWQQRQEDIRDLLEFYSQWADRFIGSRALGFEEALELMRQIKALEQMEQQILSGQWQQLDPEQLQQILGDEAARSMLILLQVPRQLSEEGLVRFGKQGLDLTPRAVRRLGEVAFGELYHLVKRDRPGSSRGRAPESGEVEPDSSRPYAFGDRLDLDITRTLLKSVARTAPGSRRLRLLPEDFYVRQREQMVVSTTVMLLDLSWSMSWERRFQAAKRVALALDHYIRAKFPKDKFYVVGFSTEARELRARELALAVWDMGHAFTNLQAGIRAAAQLIQRSGNRNSRIIVLTDGQPTAYYDKDRLRVEFPTSMFGLSPNACKATLAEVKKTTALGIHIDTFMLDDNPVLVEFVREISRINGGRAVICKPGDLGNLILIEEIKRRQPRR